MDSNFVNFDGRSVHDMIEMLLTISGDPEAMQRLMEAIAAVDEKFGPVNTELQRLEEEKQDAGTYMTVKTGPSLKSSHLQGSKVIQQIVTRYNDDPGSNSIVNFKFNEKTMEFRDQPDPTTGSSPVCVFSADEDTGWIDATLPSGASGTVQYRKKNGKVMIHISNYLPPDDYTGTTGGGQDVFTLPAGFRPDRNTFFTLVNGAWEHVFTVCVRGNSGIVQVKSNTGSNIPKTTASYGTNEFTASV